MEDALQKGEEFRRNLELISSQLQTHTNMAEIQPNKQNIQVSLEQTQLQGEIAK